MKKQVNCAVLLILTGILLAFWTGARGGPLVEGAEGRNGTNASAPLFLRQELFEQENAERSGIPFSASDLLWQAGPAACDEETATVYIPCDPAALREWESSLHGSAGASGEGGESADALPDGSGDGLPEMPSDVLEAWRRLLSGLRPASDQDRICIRTEEALLAPSDAMRTGHAFEALLLGDETAEPFRIVLTGLPAICLDKTDGAEIVRKENHEGMIRVLSSGDSSETLRCRFHVRGNITSTLPKKPYRITLVDPSGDNRKVSLLGMREDDDWILNPLATDSTRVREKTAYALWEEVSGSADHPQSSSRIRYAELFLDNTYQGLYGLMEPVDGKQLGLESGDLLYKINRWADEDPYLEMYEPAEEARETDILNQNGYSCVEIRYPKRWDATATWIPMQAFHTFSFVTEDPGTLRAAGLDPDMDSVVTLSLFCAMTHASDNNWKNTLLIAKPEKGSAPGAGAEGETGGTRYSLYRTIWDLNYIFGDVFVYSPEEGYTAFDPDSAFFYTPGEDSTYDYEAFRRADPSLQESLKEKWAQWRKDGISPEKICALLQENRELLLESGAMDREMARWPQEKDSGEALRETQTWIRDRFFFLDTYLTGQPSG